MTIEKKLEQADQSAITQFLTTEHFTLQTARSATISEANGRSTLFLSSVSSALVALAFIGQVSNMGEAFFVFSLVLLPSLFFLGVVTFVRVLETGIEDMVYVRGINRIRHYYIEAAPQISPYFILSSHDDDAGMSQNMGVFASRWQLLLTTAGMVSVINSVLAGVFAGLVLKAVFNLALLGCVIGGTVFFALCLVPQLRYQAAKWQEAEQKIRVIFPSPSGRDGTIPKN